MSARSNAALARSVHDRLLQLPLFSAQRPPGPLHAPHTLNAAPYRPLRWPQDEDCHRYYRGRQFSAAL